MPRTRRSLLVMVAAPGACALGWRRGPGHAAQVAATVRTLAVMTHVALPGPPLALAIARVTLPAGVETAAATAGGIRIIVPEGGTVLARTGAGADAGPIGPRPAAMQGDIPVAAGDALAISAADLAALRNPGTGPIVVLDAAIFPVAPGPLPSSLTTIAGVHFRLLAYGEAATLPAARFDIGLVEAAVGAGGALPPSLAVGPLLARVEAGTFAVVVRAGDAFAAPALGWPSLAGVGPAARIAPGRAIDLPDGSALFLAAGASARVANAGDGPARMLVLRLGESELG